MLFGLHNSYLSHIISLFVMGQYFFGNTMARTMMMIIIV